MTVSSSAIPLVERAPSPLPPPPSPEAYRSGAEYRDRVPIVIDNGTSELRAGFASHAQTSAPSDGYERYSGGPTLRFPPIVAKYKDRKRAMNILLVGPSAHMDTESRSKARPPTEGGLLVAQDVMENILDFTFSKLGIQTGDGAIEHPIVMTEPLCNPGYCRGLTSELLFEAYGAPSVSYGVDSLFSAYANDVGQDGLIVSSGHSATTIIPMLGGRGILANSKRMNWGGAAASDYMLRLLQLKYPAFPLRLTSSQATGLIETPGLMYTHPGGVQGDYSEHVAALSDLHKLQAEGKTVQIPFTVPEGSRRKELTDEEKQRREDRKREATNRLREMTQRNRLQKLMEKEEQLRKYTELREWKNKERKAEWLKRLENAGLDSEQELDRQEKRIQTALKRSRRREVGDDEVQEEEEVPTFPLVEIPDHELDEESIKEKRRQRLLKAGYDARQRAKAEKLEEKRQEEDRRRKDEEERTQNLQVWAQNKRAEYEEIIERMKERKRRKELLSDRKSLAAQQRMKTITSLASDGPADGGAGGRGKRKRGGGDKEDTFGADDDDWAVYRDVQGAEDSEDEEDDEQQLVQLESKLLLHDPTFSRSDTLAARQARKRALTRTFLGGTPEGEEEIAAAAKAKAQQDGEDADGADEDDQDENSKLEELARSHQVTLNVERARLAEVFYQPSLAGVDQAGLDEIMDMILRGFDDDGRRAMVKNIFVTGQHAGYARFDARLRNSIVATQPVEYEVNVRRARDPRFDAWRGMAKWCLERPDEVKSGSITRQMYEEYGSEYIKDHPFVSAAI